MHEKDKQWKVSAHFVMVLRNATKDFENNSTNLRWHFGTNWLITPQLTISWQNYCSLWLSMMFFLNSITYMDIIIALLNSPNISFIISSLVLMIGIKRAKNNSINPWWILKKELRIFQKRYMKRKSIWAWKS